MASLTQKDVDKANALMAGMSLMGGDMPGLSVQDAILCLRVLHGCGEVTAAQMLAFARVEDADDVVVIDDEGRAIST